MTERLEQPLFDAAEFETAQSEAIKRPKRIARKTYATEETVFQDSNSRIFGKILLRKDHDTELDLTPQERLDFIRACVKYAKIYGRIDILGNQLEKLEEVIRQMTDAHEGLRGIESQRLERSVTDVSEVKINPNSTEIRKETGSAFPQFGTEQVIATITVPEEEQPSGKTIRAEEIEDAIELVLRFIGMSNETVATNLAVEKKMKVTDREALLEAVNSGLVSESALGAKKSKRIEVKPLRPTKIKKS